MTIRYEIQKMGLGGFDHVMNYRTLELARNALPWFRRDTKAPLRIVRVETEIVHEDLAAASIASDPNGSKE